jgi:L-alanine-DL-glutamate epimerase-like enolase superfamily enzyme
MKRILAVVAQEWPLKAPFNISRSSRLSTQTVRVDIKQGNTIGRGECVPTAHYGESVRSVMAQIKNLEEAINQGGSREALQTLLPAGAARNALDCALWDLEAQLLNQRVSEHAAFTGLLRVVGNNVKAKNITTVHTICIDSPDKMADAARKLSGFPMIKIKLDRHFINERLHAIHSVVPNAKLLIDANESWDIELLKKTLKQCQHLPIAMIEQPLPRAEDDLLKDLNSPFPIGADESFHTVNDIAKIARCFDVINIKFDKCGGLTEAINIFIQAKQANLKVMVGCMLGTSLSMAPAMLIAQYADFVDLDAPLLLAKDSDPCLTYHQGVIQSLPRQLWGG